MYPSRHRTMSVIHELWEANGTTAADQFRPVHELTIGVGSTVGDAVGPDVGEALDGRGVAEPDELGEQLDRMRAATAINARRVAILRGSMSVLG
jgi:hypothetical protein